MNESAPDRCEVCTRVIRTRPQARRRRCGDCLDVVPLFPIAACKPRRKRSTSRGGGAR